MNELLDRKEFWLGAMALIAFIYLIALVLLMLVGTHTFIVKLALLMLAVHALELPIAFKRLAPRKPRPQKLVPLVLLFGAAWWVPAQKGLFPVA